MGEGEQSGSALRKDNSHGGGQRGHGMVGPGAQFLPVTEVDENGADPGAAAAIHVAPAVADHPGAGEVDAQRRSRIQQHAGLGFPPAVFRVVATLARSEADLNPDDLRDEDLQAGVHRRDDGWRHGAAADIGLVRRNNEKVAGGVQRTAGCWGIGVETEFVGRCRG